MIKTGYPTAKVSIDQLIGSEDDCEFINGALIWLKPGETFTEEERAAVADFIDFSRKERKAVYGQKVIGIFDRALTEGGSNGKTQKESV